MANFHQHDLERFLREAKEINRRVSEEFRERRAVMFSDVTASTAFFEKHGDFDGLILIHEYNRLMTPIIARHHGEIIKTLGDGLMVVFPDPPLACHAAIEMQRATQEINLNLPGSSTLTITVAVHAGDVFKYQNDVFGDVINTTARVSSLTNPGNILLTEVVKNSIDGADFITSFATHAQLKGKTDPIALYNLHWHPDELEKLRLAKGSKRVRAFISSVTPHSDPQTRFVEAFCRRLFTAGIESIFLRQTAYDKNDPIGKASAQIAACDCVIVLGLERSHAYYTRDKETSRYESEYVHRKYTSSWLHLEAGLAYALGKQIFAVCSSDILSDGIFDRSYNTYPVYEFSKYSAFDEGLEEFFHTIEEWAMENHQILGEKPSNLAC
jgi:class 3 adenylate cyclase